MKKIVLLLMALSVSVFATENINNQNQSKCYINTIKKGILDTKNRGGVRILAANTDMGIGESSQISVDYTGTPTLNVTGASNITNTGGKSSNTSQIETNIKFSNPINNQIGVAKGFGNISNGGTKSMTLANPNNQKISDTLTISITSKSNKHFEVGHYISNIDITCN